MTYEEIEKHYPEEFARRSIDKPAYRYPRSVSLTVWLCLCPWSIFATQLSLPPPPPPSSQSSPTHQPPPLPPKLNPPHHTITPSIKQTQRRALLGRDRPPGARRPRDGAPPRAPPHRGPPGKVFAAGCVVLLLVFFLGGGWMDCVLFVFISVPVGQWRWSGCASRC